MSSNKLPKPPVRIKANGVYQLTDPVGVARGGGLNPELNVTVPAGRLVNVLWASKRWAEVETVYEEMGYAPVVLKFRIPTNVLEDVT
jgi:hypothetical protein